MSDFIPTTMMTSQRRRIPTDSSCKSWVATIKMQNSVGISRIKYAKQYFGYVSQHDSGKTISKSSQDFRSLWLKPKWPSCGIQILVESCRMPLDCGSTMFEHSWSVPPQVDVCRWSFPFCFKLKSSSFTLWIPFFASQQSSFQNVSITRDAFTTVADYVKRP